jgi:hypothetical protein
MNNDKEVGKINFLHLCDHALISGENKISAIGIFQNITPSVFPHTHLKMFVAFNLSVKKKGKHEMSMNISQQDANQELQKINLTFVTKKQDSPAQGIVEFNSTEFNEAGKYQLTIFLDKQKIGFRDINVKKSEK